jgi:hypothetical protein
MSARNFTFAFCLLASGFLVAQTRGRDVKGVDRLREWLSAVDRHEPGQRDAPAIELGSWSRSELEALYPDVIALLELIARSGKLPPRREGGKFTASIIEELQQIAVEQERRGVNGLVKRGALLHTDIALLVPPPEGPLPAPPTKSESPLAPRTVGVTVADGRQEGLRYGAVHWDFARTLLDAVKPDPSYDDMVRLWYRATAALFTSHGQWADALPHLERARRLFPSDADILAESGYLHEAFAAPRIQDVVQRTTPPADLVFAVGSTASNLRQAETFFRRAVAVDGDLTQARVRLGHVVGLQGRHDEAVSELQRAATDTRDSQLLYDALMFLGNEEQALGHRDRARDSYKKAAALYPRAQSPHLALSELARRSGDRPGALRALQQMLTLPADESQRHDPWWTYYDGQGRDAGSLLAEVRALFPPGGQR